MAVFESFSDWMDAMGDTLIQFRLKERAIDKVKGDNLFYKNVTLEDDFYILEDFNDYPDFAPRHDNDTLETITPPWSAGPLDMSNGTTLKGVYFANEGWFHDALATGIVQKILTFPTISYLVNWSKFKMSTRYPTASANSRINLRFSDATKTAVTLLIKNALAYIRNQVDDFEDYTPGDNILAGIWSWKYTGGSTGSFIAINSLGNIKGNFLSNNVDYRILRCTFPGLHVMANGDYIEFENTVIVNHDHFVYGKSTDEFTMYRLSFVDMGNTIQITSNNAWIILQNYVVGVPYLIRFTKITDTTFDVYINGTLYDNAGAHFTNYLAVSWAGKTCGFLDFSSNPWPFQDIDLYIDEVCTSWIRDLKLQTALGVDINPVGNHTWQLDFNNTTKKFRVFFDGVQVYAELAFDDYHQATCGQLTRVVFNTGPDALTTDIYFDNIRVDWIATENYFYGWFVRQSDDRDRQLSGLDDYPPLFILRVDVVKYPIAMKLYQSDEIRQITNNKVYKIINVSDISRYVDIKKMVVGEVR